MNTAHLSGAECSRYGEHEGIDRIAATGWVIVCSALFVCALGALGLLP